MASNADLLREAKRLLERVIARLETVSRYNATPKRKALDSRYNNSPKHLSAQKRYHAKPESRLLTTMRESQPHYKLRRRLNNQERRNGNRAYPG